MIYNLLMRSYISRVILTNFRSYEKSVFDTSNSKIVIVNGNNGIGKTNLLEAVSLLSPYGPFRKAKLNQLLNTNIDADNFTVFFNFVSGDDNVNIGISYNNTIENDKEVSESRKVVVDNKDINILTLQNFVKLVWITPFMDRLFSENGTERRKFFDNLIINFYPNYSKILLNYNNLLKQRSKILKNTTYDEKWLSLIETEIVKNGVAIAGYRIEFEEKLNNILSKQDCGIFPKIQIKIVGDIEDSLKVNKSVVVEDYYKRLLLQNREMFKYNFAPSVEGVHRTDFSAFNLTKNISVDQTSAGEQKCAVISIILSYIEMLFLYYNTYPIVLIDDVLSHLDSFKINELFRFLDKIPTQIWLSGVNRSDFSFFEKDNVKFIELK